MAPRLETEGSVPWSIRLLLDAGPAGIALVEGPAFTFTYANRACRALAGGAELTGRTFAQVWPGCAVDLLPLLERARATGQAASAHEHRVELRREPGGAPRTAYLSFSFQPLSGPGGAPGGVAVHVVDRTGDVTARAREAELASERRKLLEAELATRALEAARRISEGAAEDARRKAAELDTVLHSIASGLLLHDAEGRVLRMNPAAERLLGYGAAECALPFPERLAVMDLLDARGEPLASSALPTARALRGEVVSGVEVRFARRDGSRPPFWASISAAPILGPDGVRQGAVTTLADVTALRVLQEQREDVMRAMSHDLRTPLTVVSAQAQLLMRREQPHEVVLRRAGIIRTSASRIASMIDGLVETVRLEAGLVRIAPRPVPLAPFLAELRARLRGALPVERLRLDVPDALPPVLADPPQLERIVVNLVSNALKYAGAETEVVISATASGAGGGVRLTVSDRGPGIAAEALPRLFERFYRTPGARADGLGLGLYVTKLLVERHGGAVSVESAPGEGSAFHVDLPAAP